MNESCQDGPINVNSSIRVYQWLITNRNYLPPPRSSNSLYSLWYYKLLPHFNETSCATEFPNGSLPLLLLRFYVPPPLLLYLLALIEKFILVIDHLLAPWKMCPICFEAWIRLVINRYLIRVDKNIYTAYGN